MSLLQTVGDYCQEDEKADRAIFEAAMLKRIEEKGYKMSDLMYEVFCVQRDVLCLKRALEQPKSKSKHAK